MTYQTHTLCQMIQVQWMLSNTLCIYVHNIVTNGCTITMLLYTYHIFKNVISVTYEIASDIGIGHGHWHWHWGQGWHCVHTIVTNECTVTMLLYTYQTFKNVISVWNSIRHRHRTWASASALGTGSALCTYYSALVQCFSVHIISVTYEIALDTGIGHGHGHGHQRGTVPYTRHAFTM